MDFHVSPNNIFRHMSYIFCIDKTCMCLNFLRTGCGNQVRVENLKVSLKNASFRKDPGSMNTTFNIMLLCFFTYLYIDLSL